ncbi:DUF6708 domain-containing protein [Acinetobacter bereziniae]|jgi:hypothetical protein|uniref:DUF6708 domain-containing protein n=1 Tax=Acinetobacter bereziniae TaxID=106648 RepID=UPI0029544BA4|nr:DUF6708 domain-containing protein [Acinetobacter bereziniae]MDV8154027.1 DUF6708 domain-containing protein [Acinetobacter bereziniae]
MSIKEKNYYFGYDKFKKNIPIDIADIENVLTLQDRHDLNHNWSFLRMNHDYIELIDQYYARLGKSFSIFFIFSPIIFLLFSILYIDVFYISFLILVILFFCFYPIYKYDKGKPICRPIIFNRNTQKVYFYINEQEYLEKHWLDVTYALGTSQGLGGMPIYELRAHIIEDGILKDTFLIGFPKIGNGASLGLWSFICHYMQHGMEELKPHPHPMYGTIDPLKQLTFCQRMLGSKESIQDTWRSFRCVYFNNPLPSYFAFPFDLCNLIARRIFLRIKPLPVWHSDVVKANEMDKIREEEITYRDNYEFKEFEIKDK